MLCRIIKEEKERQGWFNMAADHYLSETVCASRYNAILRFFYWQPPAVSLGFNQSIDSIDVNACNDRGWDLVKRPTGGRALLHRDDLSYSFIVPNPESSLPVLKNTYSLISQVMVCAFHRIGFEAEFVLQGAGRRTGSFHKNRICLSTRVRGEVTVRGKKVAAASQRIYPDAILQHGSIQLTGCPDDVVDIMDLGDESKAAARRSVKNDADSLQNLTGVSISRGEFIESYTDSLKEVIKLEFCNVSWSPAEIKEVCHLRPLFDLSSIQKTSAAVSGV